MFDKKPKFRFEFAINDLSNIPHTAGYCFVDISIGDGHSNGLRAALSSLKPVLKAPGNSGNSGNSDDSSKLSRPSTATESLDSVAMSSSGNIHVRTSRRKIHNFKCGFNYRLLCNLKFSVRKRDSMIGSKFLRLRVFYVPDRSKLHNHTELGLVRLNLSEYLNFDEPVTTKYLLQDSKINSILNMTLGLEELPSDYEFHTQLQIDDSKHNSTTNGSQLAHSKNTELNSRSFNVPQFQRKTVLGGLDGVINNNNSGSKQTLSTNSSDEDGRQSVDKLEQSKSEHKIDSAKFGSGTFDNVIVDPIISGLYRRVLESTWDPDLHCLLKFSPEKIVDDIFKSNGEDCRAELEKYIQKYELSNKEADGEGFKDMNGLINETKYRDNLKSWTVSWT